MRPRSRTNTRARAAAALLVSIFAALPALAPAVAVVRGAAPPPCDAPSAPGCARCCISETARCVVHSSSARAGAPGAWYNVQNFTVDCPAGCPPCAACSASDRAAYAAAARRAAGCACADPAPNDPCYAPHSCSCACAVYGALALCAE